MFLVNNENVFPLDPGVYFTSGLSDVTAIIGTDAELVCKLSSEDCEGVWYKDGQEVRNIKVNRLIAFIFTCQTLYNRSACLCAFQITPTDDLCIVKDGTYRKLIVKNLKEEDSAKYRYEADGRKTEAILKVEGNSIRINLGQ